MRVRPTISKDVHQLQIVLTGTDLFPPEMLPDMLRGFLSDEGNGDLWLTCEDGGLVIGFCYAVPEQLAEGTWNMLAIAVLPEKQSKGAGKAIVAHLENRLRDGGHRVLIAETSSADGFADTRAFYRKCGYTEEARIRDFWAEGDDKIVFWKAL